MLLLFISCSPPSLASGHDSDGVGEEERHVLHELSHLELVLHVSDGVAGQERQQHLVSVVVQWLIHVGLSIV